MCAEDSAAVTIQAAAQAPGGPAEHRPSSSLGARTLLFTSVWTAWRLHGQWDEGAERRLLWRRWGGVAPVEPREEAKPGPVAQRPEHGPRSREQWDVTRGSAGVGGVR